MDFRVSVLDLSPVSSGSNGAKALHNTLELARLTDRLGYERYWLAEHHNLPSIASSAPEIMIGHVAGVTKRIRIGAGGIMLPNHAPLKVAETFQVLEALHPGRIDLGIGRAPGTDPVTAAALRRSVDALGAEDFPRDLLDLMGLLGDRRDEFRGPGALWERFAATPAPASSPQILLLGSSGYSAQLAGVLGLPFAFAHHFDTGGTLRALELYRQAFEPSPILDRPHAIVTANVLTAETDEQALFLAGPGQLMMHSIRRGGRFEPLRSPE